jgi:hypothetical protein
VHRDVYKRLKQLKGGMKWSDFLKLLVSGRVVKVDLCNLDIALKSAFEPLILSRGLGERVPRCGQVLKA